MKSNKREFKRHLPNSDVDDPELARAPGAAPDTARNPQGAEASTGPRQVIEQAARDIRRGLRDTDQHGTPSNVPGPGVSPERSPGAQVPDEGVDVAGYSPKGKRRPRSPQS